MPRPASCSFILLVVVSLACGEVRSTTAVAEAPAETPAAQAPPADATPAAQTPAAPAAAPTSGTQEQPKTYEPSVGQDGKDVVWVPTPQPVVDTMLDLAKVTPDDYVIDLGSGDGRTVITAAKRGARALGIEFNADMVALSKRNAAEAGVSGRAAFVQGDLFESDFSKATVITMFLLPSINMQLRPKLLEMKPGTRIASNSFTMEDWEADESVTVPDCETSWCTAHFWVVPAKVDGAWQLEDGTLTLTQKFQMVSGTLGSAPVSEGRLRGDEITFHVGRARYAGRVNGNTIQGTVTGARTGAWSATRR